MREGDTTRGREGEWRELQGTGMKQRTPKRIDREERLSNRNMKGPLYGAPFQNNGCRACPVCWPPPVALRRPTRRPGLISDSWEKDI